ncbi:MAG TPA: SDR family NAD(P)-dependent oxidoreductase [Streptosporangiaceae bacterium]
MTDPAQVRDLAAAALDRHQRIDGLVNNAGASMHGPLDQVDLAEFSQVLQLNVVGLLAVTQAVLPAMRAQGFGRIVNISSGTTRRVAAGVGAYASAKTAVNMLSAVLRSELAGDGIAVSLLLPSVTATEFGGGMFTLGASPPAGHGGAEPGLRGWHGAAAAAHRRGVVRHPARPRAARPRPRLTSRIRWGSRWVRCRSCARTGWSRRFRRGADRPSTRAAA